MKKPISKKSSLLAKYSLQYEKNPKSRVFAPLAETYRKLGMHDDALKILREGIKFHPTYTLGYIVLAHIYFDQENYEIAYNTLRPFVSENLENITLQKLFAKICINLGFLEEALQTFKYLLLINPKDIDTATQVKLLEDDLLLSNTELNENDGYVEKRLTSFNNEEDDWVQVSFSGEEKRRSEVIDDSWEMEGPVDSNNPLDKFKSEIDSDLISINEHDLDDDYFYEEHDVEAEDVIDGKQDNLEEEVEDEPIITHTLVNLYCKQGHFEKALELVDSILKLHPADKATLNKKEDILRSISGEGVEPESIHPEENGHDELARLIEEKKEKDTIKVRKVEEKLNLFLDKLKNAAILANTTI